MNHSSMLLKSVWIFFVSCSLNAFAQIDEEVEKKIEQLFNTSDRGNIDSSISLAPAVIQFESGVNEDVARFRFSPPSGKNGIYLELGIPVNEDKSDTLLKNFRGLKNVNSVKFGFRSIRFSNKTPEFHSRLLDLCLARPQTLFGLQPPFPGKEDEQHPCYMANSQLLKLFKAKNADPADLKIAQDTAKVLASTTPVFYLSASYGKDNYQYFNNDTAISTSSDEEEAWSIKTGVAFINPGLSSRISLEYEYLRNFQKMNSEVRCPLVPDAEFLTCQSHATGAPEENIDSILALEYRRNFKNFALAAKFSWDLEDETAYVSLPLYFYRGGEALDTGMRADWNEENDDWEYSLFLSKKFDLFED